MLRLVVIYQLVLSLVVGPMLCCCVTARLIHGTDVSSRSPVTASKARDCCGQKPSSNGQPKHNGGQPGDHSKCPCKDGAPQAVVAPESAVTAAEASSSQLTFVLDLDSALLSGVPSLRFKPSVSRDTGVAWLSTADLLFAHHNLRC